MRRNIFSFLEQEYASLFDLQIIIMFDTATAAYMKVP